MIVFKKMKFFRKKMNDWIQKNLSNQMTFRGVPNSLFWIQKKNCPTQGSEQPFRCLEHKVTKTFAL